MCGIVGYLGPQPPKDVIIQGLKTLEYRGYDSAGVAILDQGDFKRVRAEGKLVNLSQKLQDEKFSGRLGIGHTRWATHGVPSERNAHPHSHEGVYIVHNGIIENYDEIRTRLLDRGATLESETDTELVAHLIAANYKETKDFFKAVLKTVPELRGAFAILVVHKNHPDEMVAFKNGPPMVVGVGEKEMIIASDIQAIVPYTRKVIYIEDDELVHVVKNDVKFFDQKGKEIKKKTQEVSWTPDKAEKQGYSHFMLKEIFEQPRAVAAAFEPHIDLKTQQVMLNRVGFGVKNLDDLRKTDVEKDWQETQKFLKSVPRMVIIACGTSYYAGLVAKYLIETLAGIPVEVDIASEFRYRHPVLQKDTLAVFISQSGETADTIAAMRLVKENGLKTMSLCNVPHSSLDRECNGHLYMNAGTEIGVASTKALSCSIAVMNVFALALAKIHGRMPVAQEKQQVDQLLAAPSLMEKVLAYDKFFEDAAQTLTELRGFLYMGRGVHYPIALEGALKLKELAYMHAEGYAAGEMKHGPLALIDERMGVVMLLPKDEWFEKTLSNLEEVKARGGQVISISTGENEKLKKISRNYLSLPSAPWFVTPLLELIPLQLMSFHIANHLGYDVDQPRNLAKSVTVE